jgi:hypothetical protein
MKPTPTAASPFDGIPIEYVIPKTAKYVFVSDYFVKDVQGGAELTSEALIKKAPEKLFKLHSKSLTKKMLDANKDKYWIFGNFVTLSEYMLQYIPRCNLSYSIIEYDFKFCAYRSTNRHIQVSGDPCNCAKENHGLLVAHFFEKADRIFWMSSGQKDSWLSHVPELKSHKGHVVLSSVFDDETLDKLTYFRLNPKEKKKSWAVLGGGSWIKGVEETQKWCKLKKIQFEVLPSLPYAEFVEKLSEYPGLIFLPLDKDTCPRLTLEARVMGLDVMTNDNVLQKKDSWYASSAEECEAYLRSRAACFWEQIVQARSA